MLCSPGGSAEMLRHSNYKVFRFFGVFKEIKELWKPLLSGNNVVFESLTTEDGSLKQMKRPRTRHRWRNHLFSMIQRTLCK